MDDMERETSSDDFAVQITDLNQSDGQEKPRGPRFTPRRRRLSMVATTVLFVLVVGLLLSSVSEVRSLLGQAFEHPASTSTPTALSGSMSVYLRGNPTWGHFILDGKLLAHTPVIGYDRPLTLIRGLHTIVWQVEPFKPKTCAFTVIDASTVKGSCFLNSEMTTNFDPGVSAMIIAFFASLNDLSTAQRAPLTEKLQAAFTSYDSESQVQSGELYAVSEEAAQIDPSLCRPFESLALCYARADQPLTATLSLHMDTLTSNDDPCVASSQCDSYRQDCRALCEDPVVLYNPRNMSGWSVNAVIGLLWSYSSTLTDQVVASAQPNSAVRGSQTYQLVSVHLDWSTQSGWQITLFPTYGLGFSSDGPVCAQATGDTMSVLGASFDNNSNMYVRQSISNPTHLALGCLTIAAQPADQVSATPTSTADVISPASFLSRFGVLLAVNASAHKVCPNLPVADANEKSLAQNLLVSSTLA